MDLLVTLNNGRSGRDKVFRLTQYTIRLISGVRGVPENFRKVEKNLASFRLVFAVATLVYRCHISVLLFRKLLRFGTFLDTLYGCKRTIHYSDPNLRVITTLIRCFTKILTYYLDLLAI